MGWRRSTRSFPTWPRCGRADIQVVVSLAMQEPDREEGPLGLAIEMGTR
jgi:hypothetical protein